MALLSTFGVKDNGQVSRNFVETKRSGQRVERLRADSTLQLPTRMVIDHSVTGKGSTLTDRHLIQVAITESDGNGGTVTSIVNITVSVPRNAPNTVAARNAMAFAVNTIGTSGDFVTSATFDSVLQGQS